MAQSKDEKKALKHNTISLIIIQALKYILPFITLPYVSRIFRVSDYGVIFFASVMMNYFERFIKFGFDLSAVRQIAVHSNNPKEVSHIFSTVFAVQVLFLTIGFILLNIIVFSVPKFAKDWLIYYFTYLGLVGMVLNCRWLYQGIARMRFLTVLTIIARLISIILIFTVIKKADDYIWYPLLGATAGIISGLVSIIYIKKHFNIKFYIPKWKSIFESIKYSSQFFLTKVAISLYRGTNAFVLGLVVTSTAVAYYTAADKIFWAAIALYSTFINALFPYMSKNKDLVFFKKMLKYLIILAVGASLFLLFASKYVILIFYSAKYLESIRILQIFSLSFACYVFVDTLGFPLLGAFGYVKETNMGFIFGGIYNVLGLAILYCLNQINITNVAILVSSTYLIMFLHRIYYIHKYKLLNKKEIAA